VIERSRGGDPAPVYLGLCDEGRRIPAGVVFVSSWVTDDLGVCHQVMQCGPVDTRRLDEALVHLVELEVVPVVSSGKVRRRALAD